MSLRTIKEVNRVMVVFEVSTGQRLECLMTFSGSNLENSLMISVSKH